MQVSRTLQRRKEKETLSLGKRIGQLGMASIVPVKVGAKVCLFREVERLGGSIGRRNRGDVRCRRFVGLQGKGGLR